MAVDENVIRGAACDRSTPEVCPSQLILEHQDAHSGLQSHRGG